MNQPEAAPEISSLPPGINPWRARICLLTLAHTVGTACYLSIMAMGPVIRDDMNISATEFGFFMSAVFGAQLISAMPSGAITDRFGVGWTLFMSMFVMMAGTTMFAIADQFYTALSAAFLIGLGYSFVNPATAKAVMRWFPVKWRGTAMGLKQLGVPLGGVLGAGGGALAAYMDWRHVLWIAAGMIFVTALLWLPLTRKPVQGAVDIKAILRDLKIVVTNRNMNIIFVSCTMFNTSQSSLSAYIALFMRDVAQTSQPVAAMAVAFAQSASAFGRFGYSYLSDVMFGGRRKIIVVCVVIVGGMSCGAAYFVNPEWPHWGLMLLAAVMGGTISSYAALILSMTAETAPSSLVGSAIGYNAVAWSIGGVIGPPVFGQILDWSDNNYGLAWVAIGIVMLTGAAFMARNFKEPIKE